MTDDDRQPDLAKAGSYCMIPAFSSDVPVPGQEPESRITFPAILKDACWNASGARKALDLELEFT